jgi:hypothetical protein
MANASPTMIGDSAAGKVRGRIASIQTWRGGSGTVGVAAVMGFLCIANENPHPVLKDHPLPMLGEGTTIGSPLLESGEGLGVRDFDRSIQRYWWTCFLKRKNACAIVPF